MRPGARNLFLLVASLLLLILPPAYLLVAERRSAAAGPVETLLDYLRAAYARDFRQAYHLISSEDRQLKPGSRVVSHAFDMGDWKPDKTERVDGRTVYFWTIPAKGASKQ